MTLRVLCIDIEGGSGGSSRSLLEVLKAIDRDQVEPEVWFRRRSSFIDSYAAIGITSRLEAGLPSFSTLRRFSRNLFAIARALYALMRMRKRLTDIADEIDKRFDLVHFNHEGLFLVARWLRKRCRAPFVMHIRTMCWGYGSPFGRWQAREILRVARECVFITENEQSSFAHAAGQGGEMTGSVIYNVVQVVDRPPDADPRIPSDDRFKVAVLSNFSWIRGIDRLLEIAQALADSSKTDILFVVAGVMTLPRSLPGALGAARRRGLDLAGVAMERGLADMFLFLGHVDEPDRVLAGCDALIKPTREDNPWGRDILEGLAAGLPVITYGRYDRFVENEVTGCLFSRFDVAETAQAIARLAADRTIGQRLGAEGRDRVLSLCNGPARAADLVAVWRRAAAAHR